MKSKILNNPKLINNTWLCAWCSLILYPKLKGVKLICYLARYNWQCDYCKKQSKKVITEEDLIIALDNL